MKHLILIIGIISSILQACQLTEVDGYVGGSSIYFSIQRELWIVIFRSGY